MIEYFLVNFSSYSKLALYLIVYFIVSFIVCFPIMRTYVLAHWDYFKNKSYIIPISGIFLKDADDTIAQATNKNYMSVLWNVVRGSITTLSRPMYLVLEKLVDKLKFFQTTLNNFRYQIAITRKFLMHLVKNVYEDLLLARKQVIDHYILTRKTIQTNFANMDGILDNVIRTYDYMQYLVFSPIWKNTQLYEGEGVKEMAKYFTGPEQDAILNLNQCFVGSNPIQLHNGRFKQISDVVIGDSLLGDNHVTAVIQCAWSGEIYAYNNILVTGSHFVKYNNKWMRIKNVPTAFVIDNHRYRKIYCLVTETGEININETIFKDYLDMHDYMIYNKINKMITNHLNIYSIPGKTYNLLTGIHPEIDVSKNTILGKILIDKGQLDVFYWKGLYVSADILVYENNNWVRVSNILFTGAKYMGKNKNPFVNYITSNSILKLGNGETIRDFIEINNEEVLGNIDTLIDENINI